MKSAKKTFCERFIKLVCQITTRIVMPVHQFVGLRCVLLGCRRRDQGTWKTNDRTSQYCHQSSIITKLRYINISSLVAYPFRVAEKEIAATDCYNFAFVWYFLFGIALADQRNLRTLKSARSERYKNVMKFENGVMPDRSAFPEPIG